MRTTYHHQFHSDTGAFAFPSGNPLDERPTHNGVGTGRQPEFGNHPLRKAIQIVFRRFTGQTEFGGEANGFARRGGDLERIVLCDKGNLLAHLNIGRIDGIVVQAHIGLDGDGAPRTGAPSENVEEGGFSKWNNNEIGNSRE